MSIDKVIETLRPAVERIQAQCAVKQGKLIAVIKRQPHSTILAAYHLGLRDFAHSYVQEAIDCRTELGHLMPDARWHFIGRIQSNKTRHLVEDWFRIHSVDRLKTARRLGKASILIQVRLGGEHSKAGVEPAELEGLIDQIRTQTEVNIKGLMALPPPRDSWGEAHYFAELATWRDRLMTQGYLQTDGGELSMGTSGDYLDALTHGANWVRVGTALLGERLAPTVSH